MNTTTEQAPHLMTWVSADAGSQASCSCGWRGPWRSAARYLQHDEQMARADMDRHRARVAA